jgi:predicted Zn-dependent protease
MTPAIRRRLIALPLLLMLAAACVQVPITGRSQMLLLSGQEVNTMSFQAYDEFMAANKLSADAANTQMVKRCGARIQKAVEKYFADNKMSSHLAGYNWEFNLVDSKEVNAWCMPGGKVVIYTGILPIAQDEKGLAVVMGHEVAHAVANHGNERMSQGMLVNLGAAVLSEAMAEQPKETKDMFLAAFGMGANLAYVLPHSRLHESEADRLGLIFMSMAGYHPSDAFKFWERMAALKQGKSGPEFLSTHPSDETRINNLKRLAAEEAIEYYKPFTGTAPAITDGL